MDIEELLKKLRTEVLVVRAIQSRTAEDGDLSDKDRNDLLDAGEALAEGFQALDEWLAKGGYLPHDWTRREVRRELERLS